MSGPVDDAAATLEVQLPAVAHDFPAAVLLVDTGSEQVVFANDLAQQLAPDLTFPVGVEDWSRAAGLQVVSGAAAHRQQHAADAGRRRRPRERPAGQCRAALRGDRCP